MGELYTISGFVWIDEFHLSLCQLALVFGQMAYWTLRAWRPPSTCRVLLESVLSLLLLLYTFQGVQLGIDVGMTWNQLPRLTPLSWYHRLNMLGFINYLKYQPPLWMLWLSSLPSFAIQQVCSVCVSFGVIAVLLRRGERRLACLILGMPLFQFMATQPMNDLYVAFFGVLARDAVMHDSKGLAAIWIAIACQVKYTVLLLLPVYIVWIRWWILLPICSQIWYWEIVQQTYWGVKQARYLLHSFSMGVIKGHLAPQAKSTDVPLPPWLTLFYTARWRFRTLTIPALTQAWWWLFPWYTSWSWRQGICIVVLLGGYGNIKYSLLLLAIL